MWLRTILMAALSPLWLSAHSSNASPADTASCDATELSSKGKKKLSSWQRKMRDSKNQDTVRQDVVTAQSETGFNCRDQAVFYLYGLQIDEKSEDPNIAIPALEVLLPIKGYDQSGDRSRRFFSLSTHYQKTQAFDELKDLALSELQIAPEKQVPRILRKLAIAQAGLGQHDDAIASLRDLISTQSDELAPADFRLAIALLERLDRADDLSFFESKASERFDALRWRPQLPGMTGDRLDTVLSYLTDPTYTAKTSKLPVISYPNGAASRGLEGMCYVYFDTDAVGKPIDVEAICTDKAFKTSAVRGLRKARFEPLIVDGQEYVWQGLEYPLEYNLVN